MFNRYDEFHQCDVGRNPYIFDDALSQKEYSRNTLTNEVLDFENSKTGALRASASSHKQVAKQGALALLVTRIGDSTRQTALEYLISAYDKFA
jgi:hypothetical protein